MISLPWRDDVEGSETDGQTSVLRSLIPQQADFPPEPISVQSDKSRLQQSSINSDEREYDSATSTNVDVANLQFDDLSSDGPSENVV